MTHRNACRAIGAGLLHVAFAAGLTALPGAAARADTITLTETGSTLLYPLFQIWAKNYAATHPGVTITTGSTGSGEGIADAVAGKVEIGTSDAYMSDDAIQQTPQILNVALAISAQTVNYNLPGVDTPNLKITGPILAGIYRGEIREWDDKAIVSLNPGVKLPHETIVPIRRAEGSGDTFVFTQYLTFSTPSWEDAQGFGTTIQWPNVTSALDARGNSGVVDTLRRTPYSIGYVGVSFHADIDQAHLGTAALQSYSGEFLLPTADTIQAAAAALGPRTPADERLTLVNAPGTGAYPLINYEYAIISMKQPSPEIAAALRRFLLWAIAPDETNAKLLDDAHFIPLPAHTWVLSHDQLERIQ